MEQDDSQNQEMERNDKSRAPDLPLTQPNNSARPLKCHTRRSSLDRTISRLRQIDSDLKRLRAALAEDAQRQAQVDSPTSSCSSETLSATSSQSDSDDEDENERRIIQEQIEATTPPDSALRLAEQQLQPVREADGLYPPDRTNRTVAKDAIRRRAEYLRRIQAHATPQTYFAYYPARLRPGVQLSEAQWSDSIPWSDRVSNTPTVDIEGFHARENAFLPVSNRKAHEPWIASPKRPERNHYTTPIRHFAKCAYMDGAPVRTLLHPLAHPIRDVPLQAPPRYRGYPVVRPHPDPNCIRRIRAREAADRFITDGTGVPIPRRTDNHPPFVKPTRYFSNYAYNTDIYRMLWRRRRSSGGSWSGWFPLNEDPDAPRSMGPGENNYAHRADGGATRTRMCRDFGGEDNGRSRSRRSASPQPRTVARDCHFMGSDGVGVNLSLSDRGPTRGECRPDRSGPGSVRGARTRDGDRGAQGAVGTSTRCDSAGLAGPFRL